MMCANADATKKCLHWGWGSTLSLRSCILTLTLPVCPCWETSNSGEGAGIARLSEGRFG